MPIVLTSGLQVTNTEPVDSRFVAVSSTERNNLSINNIYEGLVVYLTDTNRYTLLVSASNPLTDACWVDIVLSSGTQSLTGSIFGTASYALTASHAPAYLPLTGGTIDGNVTVNGTASITFLNVQYETASVIYSSGSNQFGDAANDTQTLYGTVLIPTGSLAVTGAVAITGSNFTWNGNNVTTHESGVSPHVPYFKTADTLATSSIYQSGSTSVIINLNANTVDNPEALYVWQPHPTSINVISGKGTLNNYLQLNIQNESQGENASSDIVATAHNGNESINYIDMGINGLNYTGVIGGPNDGYLYSTGVHLHIGNATPGQYVGFFAGGDDVDANMKLVLDANNEHQMTGSLEISGSLTAKQGITGSLFGSASYALTASYASNVPLTASYAISASQAINANTADSATNATSASHALQADNAINATYAATAGNGGVTKLVGGSGITLLPSSGEGQVTIIASAGGGVTIISGSLITGSFTNTTSYTFNHNLNTRTPIITVFDSNYNQIIPENIHLVDSASAVITFPTLESGFAIGSTGGTTGTAYSSSYALFATYADTASFAYETDPIFVAKSGSFATTGSNRFIGNQIITGSLIISGSSTLTNIGAARFTGSVGISGSTIQIGNNTLTGNTVLSGSINISGSTTVNGTTNFYGNHRLSGSNIIEGNTVLSGSFEVSGSTILHNSVFIVTGSTFIKGQTQISGSTGITGSFQVRDGDINIVSGSSFTRWGNKLFNYGQFSDTTIQSGSADTAYAMKLNTTDFALNTRIVSESRITVDNTGIYNLQFSAQLGNTANTTVDFDIWFAYTGSNIPNSNTNVTVNKVGGSLGRQVAAWNFAHPIQAGDYVEIMWSCNAGTGQLQSAGTQTVPDRPAIPSVIATITQIA